MSITIGDDGQTVVQTGPELYDLGLCWLRQARFRYQPGVPEKIAAAQAAAAIAAAAFAGAQAAAQATLGADESNSDVLSKAWRTVVGDVETTPHA